MPIVPRHLQGSDLNGANQRLNDSWVTDCEP